MLKNILSLRCFLYLFFVVSVVSCKSYSKYTIDGTPQVKADPALLGVWKAVEDTNRYDYIAVQGEDDEGGARPKHNGKMYYITRMDMNGINPHFQQFHAFLSEINKARFINIDYRYVPVINGEFKMGKGEYGYFFVRILAMNKAQDTLTTCVVADPKMLLCKDHGEVRSRITANLNEPSFYSDTLHFYKVSSYHTDLKETMKIANPDPPKMDRR